MNSPHTVDSIRITRWCWPAFVGNRPGPNGGVYWVSEGSFWMKDIRHQLPPLEFITEFSPSNQTHVAIQTIADGKADMDIDYYQLYWQRLQFVNFLYPTISDVDKLHIFSSNMQSDSTDIILGAFDLLSYLFIGMVIVLFALVLWLSLRYSKLVRFSCKYQVHFQKSNFDGILSGCSGSIFPTGCSSSSGKFEIQHYPVPVTFSHEHLSLCNVLLPDHLFAFYCQEGPNSPKLGRIGFKVPRQEDLCH